MRVLLVVAVIACPVAHADDAAATSSLPDHQILAEPPAANPSPQAVLPDMGPSTAKTNERTAENYFDNFRQGPDDYSITSVARGLSTHRPMYVLPYTYSSAYDGRHTEVVFQISAKQRLFGTNFYFGYTQKSFWQLYNKRESSPFHETDYNPELFYRWAPTVAWLNHWGADAGFEHESNGRGLPESRSWNRVYVAPFQAKGKYLVYLKFWYRLPERRKTGPTDAEGDDNPDIQRYVGHAEFQVQRQFFDQHLAHLSVRANPATGKGSAALTYSIPSRDGSLFYCLNVFSGYGESLIDYNRPITRIGIGVMMTR